MDFLEQSNRYEKIINAIEDFAIQAKGVENVKLPSENHLAKKLNVSRAHVREVYRAFCIFGIFESRQGEGTFLKEKVEYMSYKFLSMVMLRNALNAEDMLEVRKILETGIAENAATNRTPADVKDMEICLESMRLCTDCKEMSKLDTRLHYIIGRACGNKMLVELSNIISGLVHKTTSEHWKYILSDKNPYTRVKTFEQHKELVDSIINKKPYIARVSAQEHIDFVMRSIKRYKIEGN